MMIQIKLFELQLRGYCRDVKVVVKLISCVVPELGLFLGFAIFVRDAAWTKTRVGAMYSRPQCHKAEELGEPVLRR